MPAARSGGARRGVSARGIDVTLRLLAAIVAWVPLGAIVPIGSAIGWIAGTVLRVRRVLVEDAMRLAEVADPRATAGRMYRDLGRGVIELLWLAGARRSGRRAAIAAVDLDPEVERSLVQAMASGPVVLMASHTGNWELAGAAAARWLEAHGKRLYVVAKPMRERGVDAFVARLRDALGVRAIHPRGAVAAARRVLQSGDVVVMPIDQVPERASHGVWLPFLGGSALVDRAPATIAWRARATVLVVAAERAGEAHRVRVLEAIARPLDPEVSARAWIDETTARATSALDAFVRGAPHAWLWLHRRWRAPRSALAGPLPPLPCQLLSRRAMQSNPVEHHG